jgi:hypothetical protein
MRGSVASQTGCQRNQGDPNEAAAVAPRSETAHRRNQRILTTAGAILTPFVNKDRKSANLDGELSPTSNAVVNNGTIVEWDDFRLACMETPVFQAGVVHNCSLALPTVVLKAEQPASL